MGSEMCIRDIPPGPLNRHNSSPRQPSPPLRSLAFPSRFRLRTPTRRHTRQNPRSVKGREIMELDCRPASTAAITTITTTRTTTAHSSSRNILPRPPKRPTPPMPSPTSRPPPTRTLRPTRRPRTPRSPQHRRARSRRYARYGTRDGRSAVLADHMAHSRRVGVGVGGVGVGR